MKCGRRKILSNKMALPNRIIFRNATIASSTLAFGQMSQRSTISGEGCIDVFFQHILIHRMIHDYSYSSICNMMGIFHIVS